MTSPAKPGAHQLVAILDYGSQFTQLIARRCRELGHLSKILPGDVSLERLREMAPSAVVLSGGPSSVYDVGAPTLPAGFLAWQEQTRLPTLGICYGMQLVARDLGGKVVPGETREYGRMQVRATNGKTWHAWMSHGDEVKEPPAGFEVVAHSASGKIASMDHPGRRICGLQFHPEVTHTEYGTQILRDFFQGVAGLKPDWSMSSVLEEQVRLIREKVGSRNHVLCALSGGVDSAVAAVLVHRAIGDRLHCVFVDTGLMRHRERERLTEMFNGQLGLPVECVDASEAFLGKLAGVSDPERKRKIIGAEFITTFDAAAERLGKRLGEAPKFLVQGTLYPDVIESSPGHKHAATIKSHHNVGGLPKDMKFQLIEPLRDLFKDEVRALGRELGVPETFVKRHPFPGPGLAVRILGEITPERVAILQAVDEIYVEALKKEGLYDQIWQAFAVFLPIRSVGVMGDGRTHDHVVALRAVTSTDGMTADWFPMPYDFLARVSNRISNEVRGVNRVVYDVSSKPPATIEWE